MNRSYIYLGVAIAVVIVALVLNSRPRVEDESARQVQAAQSGSDAAPEAATVPVPGMVTMVDLGAKSCIPCKMMEPILAELEREYAGKAAIIFVDVRVRGEQAQRFGIRAIPTQIFFDKSGKEVLRHQGFMDKASIEAELAKLGVK